MLEPDAWPPGPSDASVRKAGYMAWAMQKSGRVAVYAYRYGGRTHVACAPLETFAPSPDKARVGTLGRHTPKADMGRRIRSLLDEWRARDAGGGPRNGARRNAD